MSQSSRARARRANHPLDVARPFIWIAAMAFSVGFWAYLAAAPLLGR